jgi:hypothetical protein
MKEKIKWVSKYISRPLLILVLLAVIVYKFYPELYSKMGIDIQDIGKYAFWFFLIKGLIWIVILIGGISYFKKMKK